jgi:hypothetical protein
MQSLLSELLRRPPGLGWLVLSGGSLPEDLVQRVLALVDQAGGITAVVPSPENLPEAEPILQAWTDISGWSGRAVDCDSSEILEDALAEAALAVLPDLAGAQQYLRAIGQTDAGEFLLAALDAGVTLVCEGAAAEALGELIADSAPSSPGLPALRWIPGAVLQTRFRGGATFPLAGRRKDLFRIGLPEGVAIAMGPAGEREMWGDEKPTITFRQWWKT